jgi:hypothetical protein
MPFEPRPKPGPNSRRPDQLDMDERQTAKQPVEVKSAPLLELANLPERWRPASWREGACTTYGSGLSKTRNRNAEAIPSPCSVRVPLVTIEIATRSRQREHGVRITVDQPRQEPGQLAPLPMQRPAMTTAPTTAAAIEAPTILDRVKRRDIEAAFRDTAWN